MISKRLILLVGVACLVLSGCSSTTQSASEVKAAVAPDLSEAERKAILVNTLRQDCSGVNQYVLTPSNWITLTQSPILSEFVLEGDGGALYLNVILDGTGGANVVVSEADQGVTNLLLFNSGCRTLATQPPTYEEPQEQSNVADYPTCEKLANTIDGGLRLSPQGGWHWGMSSGRPGYCVLPNSSEVYYYSGE